MSIDTEKFQSLMKESRELAKKNWKGSGDAAVEDIWFRIKDKLGATEFLGYESNQAEGVVLSLLSKNKEVNELKENDEGMIIVNQTTFLWRIWWPSRRLQVKLLQIILNLK